MRSSLATELVNKEAPADAGPSTEPVSVKDDLATAKAVAKKAQDQLILLQQKHDTLKSDLWKGLDKTQKD